MSEDTVIVHRLKQLETGFIELRHEDNEVKKEVNELKKEVTGVSSEVRLLAKTMSDLTAQITILVKQNVDKDSQQVYEMREKIIQEGRFAKVELQLKILAIISSAAVVSLVGIIISTLTGKTV